jgi:hypothetical protein
MPVTIDDLLRSSFRCIGQLLPGFGHSPSERVDALFILNAMLDSWATDDLNAFCSVIQAFTLIADQGTYTVGPSGDWDGNRPTEIDQATLVVLTNPVQPLRLDLELVKADRWQQIKLQLTASTLPTTLWYNPTLTLGTINIWPVPTTANQVELLSTQQLAGGFTLGTTIFTAPPGYLDAVRYQLAIRLAMEWDKPLKPGVVALATEALAKIQRLNAPTPQMDCNPAVPMGGGQRGGFNRLTGD